MRKIVINDCYGGFGLSHEGIVEYAKRKGFDLKWKKGRKDKNYSTEPLNGKSFLVNYQVDGKYFYAGDIERDDPDLIAVVQEIGKKANGNCSSLKIVEIPDGVKWIVEEYDGTEWIAEQHERWS